MGGLGLPITIHPLRDCIGLLLCINGFLTVGHGFVRRTVDEPWCRVGCSTRKQRQLFHWRAGCRGCQPVYCAFYGKCLGLRTHSAASIRAISICSTGCGYGCTDGGHQLEPNGTTLATQARRLDGDAEADHGLSPLPDLGMVDLGGGETKWCGHHGSSSRGTRAAGARAHAFARRADRAIHWNRVVDLRSLIGKCTR